jgi:hypothetical protein
MAAWVASSARVHRAHLRRGTEGTNSAPSSGESVTNLTFGVAFHRRPSAARGRQRADGPAEWFAGSAGAVTEERMRAFENAILPSGPFSVAAIIAYVRSINGAQADDLVKVECTSPDLEVRELAVLHPHVASQVYLGNVLFCLGFF